MNRAQIDRRIYAEVAREGLLGPWVVHSMQKAKHSLRRDVTARHGSYKID